MAIQYWSAEGGTSGTTITAGNSGGNSGTAFNAVNNTSMTALEYSNAQAAHGGLSAHFNGPNPSQGYLRWTGMAVASIGGYGYFRWNGSLPGVAQDFLVVRAATTQAMAIGTNASNQVQVKNRTGTALVNWTVPSFSGSVWYRIAVSCIPATSTTGTIAADLYLGDSLTPISGMSYSSNAVDAGATSVAEFWMGKTTSAVVLEMYVDDMAINTSGTAQPPLPEDIARPALVMATRWN